MTGSSQARPHAPLPRLERVVFIDVARVLATLMMLFGHTVDALIGPAYRGTTAFNVWTFLRGLTPTTFTLVSGFALALVSLHASTHERPEVSAVRRLRRFGFFLILGYALHYPAANIAGWKMLTTADWRGFTAVDVLQAVAVTLTLLQLLALWCRSILAFAWASTVVAVVMVMGTPFAWRWSPDLPTALMAYLNPSTGSIFPLFPWMANGAVGAVLGAWYLLSAGPTPGARSRRTLLPAGLIMLVAALAMRASGWEPFGAGDLGAGRPSQFLLQVGLSCTLLALLASVVDLYPRRSAWREDFAQESLTVYVVHGCIVYGSPWNKGLRQYWGATLDPTSVGLTVLALWITMAALAIGWSRFKRARPRDAKRLSYAVLGLLFILLLV